MISEKQQTRYMIGGAFEIPELAFGEVHHLDRLTKERSGTWTLSGRSAFGLLLDRLKTSGVHHVHLPSYLCASILLPVKTLGLEYSFYPVDRYLVGHPDPPKGCAVVVIHYFGWINEATDQLREHAGKDFFLIEDASQALLSPWRSGEGLSHTAFISPRKFGGCGLGGWCSIHSVLTPTSEQSDCIAWRSIASCLARGEYLFHKQQRVDETVEKFYLANLSAVEAFLDENPMIDSVPQFVLELLAGTDWNGIGRARRRNWLHMHAALEGAVDPLCSELPSIDVPLGYVVRLKSRDIVRSALARQRAFCSVHWPLPSEVDEKRFPEAKELSETLLTLPIDQRYETKEMDRFAESLRTAIRRREL